MQTPIVVHFGGFKENCRMKTLIQHINKRQDFKIRLSFCCGVFTRFLLYQVSPF